MNKTLEKISEKYPIGQPIMYSNHGKRGDGNEATVVDYLYRSSRPEKVAYIEIKFKHTLGNHTVTPNQINKYYIKQDQ